MVRYCFVFYIFVLFVFSLILVDAVTDKWIADTYGIKDSDYLDNLRFFHPLTSMVLVMLFQI